MGLESGPSRGITISPRDLVAAADPNVVTPTAVAALGDAFAKGFITQDDLAERISLRTKKKKELDLAQTEQALAETKDPELIQARRNQALAAGDAAQANRAMIPLQAKAKEAELKAAILDADLKGRGMAEMQNALSKAGWGVAIDATGVTADNSAEISRRFGVLHKFVAEKAKSSDLVEKSDVKKQELKYTDSAGNAVTSISKDPSIFYQGKDIEPRQYQQAVKFRAELEQHTPASYDAIGAPTLANLFSQAAPGTIVTKPEIDLGGKHPTVWLTEQLNAEQASPERRNQVLSAYTDAGSNAQAAVDAFSGIQPGAVADLVQPRGPVLGQGGVIEIKEAAVKPAEEPKPIPFEGVKELTLARQAVSIGERLKERYEDLIKTEPGLTGFLDGRVATWTASRQWNAKVAGFERDATAILAPLAKGIYNETGVLSDKDIERYRSVIPDIRDQPKVGTQKVNDLLGEVFSAYANKVETWNQAGYNAGGFATLAKQNLDKLAKLRSETGSTPAATPSAAANAPITLSTGRKIVRGADGQFYEER